MRSTVAASFNNRISVFILSFLSVLTISAQLSVDAAGEKTVLTPHRATYDLTLDQASGRSGIVAIKGRMAYEFTGAACEGYTVNLRGERFVTDPETPLADGDTLLLMTLDAGG